MALALASVAFGGCGGGGSGGGTSGSAAISSQPLSGKLGGQPWTFGTGQTDSLLSSSTQYFVDSYAASFAPCSDSAPTGVDDLILTLPTAVGSYNLGLDLNETFYVASTGDNWVATSGHLVISAITATTISGGANFAYDTNNTVDGQFQVTICP